MPHGFNLLFNAATWSAITRRILTLILVTLCGGFNFLLKLISVGWKIDAGENINGII